MEGIILFVLLLLAPFAISWQDDTTTAQCGSELPLLPNYYSSTIMYNVRNVERYKFTNCRRMGNCEKYPGEKRPIDNIGRSTSLREVVDDRTKTASLTAFTEFTTPNPPSSGDGTDNTTQTLLMDKIIWNDGLTGITDFISVVTVGYPDGMKFCLTDSIYEDAALDWLFGFNPNCGGNHSATNCGYPSVTSMLHAAGCWTMVNDSAVIRGVDVVEYTTQWHIEEWKADLDVKYFWSNPKVWHASQGEVGHSIPIAVIISGNAFTEEGAPVGIEDEIVYQDFFEVEPSPMMFYPPSDMYCKGRAMVDSLPKSLPDFYSFSSENVWHWQFPGQEKEQTIVDNRKEWYDYGFNLSRVDSKPLDWSHPQNPFNGPGGIISDIQDFRAGISYKVNQDFGNCSVMALTEDAQGGGDIYIDENGKLHMKDPMHFFHMNQKFAFNGVYGMDRGILMDAFVTTHTLIEKPGTPETNYTTVVYLLSSLYLEEENGQDRRLLPARIISYPQEKYNDKRAWTQFNIFGFSTSVTSISDFDITNCFDINHMKRISITMSWHMDMDIKNTIREFKSIAMLTIVQAGQVAPLRIQHMDTRVMPEKKTYDLIFTLVDYPPINLTEINLPQDTLIDIQTVMKNLETVVNSNNFIIPVYISSGSSNLTFVNSIGVAGSLKEVDLQDDPALNPTSQSTTADKMLGYTSGAMAGLAFGMILLGTVVAGAVYYFMLRNNVRAGLPVMRGIDNPLQGLVDFNKK